MIIIHERMPAVETGYLYIQNIIIKWRQAGGCNLQSFCLHCLFPSPTIYKCC